MIRLKMKNRNMTFAKKLQKKKNHHEVKLINIKILHAKNSLLGKTSGKQPKKMENQGKKKLKLERF